VQHGNGQAKIAPLMIFQQSHITSTAKSNDQTPQMHQSKHFDFIEEVDESENASAYISRMTSLKKGGHLPNFNTDALGSFVEEKVSGEDEAIEVDLDVGFVQKSLAPIFSDEYGTWDELDGAQNSDVISAVEERDRYACRDRSASSLEEEGDMVLGSKSSTHFCAPAHPNREDLSQNGTCIDQQDTNRSSFQIPSSKTSTSFVDRDDESFVCSTKVPLPFVSSSLNDSDNDHLPKSSKDEEARAHDEETMDAFPSHHDLSQYMATSYDSDNDEWCRKRDLATRKTQDPNSWITRTTSGISSKLSFVTATTPKIINGVDAAKSLTIRNARHRGYRSRIPGTRVWKLSYKDRCKQHPGYFDVDYYSLIDTSDVSKTQPHSLDFAPWEIRDVRQYFLHDQSISLSKNWFGKLQRTRGNQRVREAVAHPRSMEMPMENKPHPEEWTEEWYKVWKAPNRSNSSFDSRSYSDSASEEGFDSRSGGSRSVLDDSSSYIGKSSSSHSASGYGSFSGDEAHSSRSDYGLSENDEDSLDEDDAPQCGELINVKPKIGERVTRIHPDFTCQLRKSRWRKKYFPRGTFPYDK
jgi:hypothetical protein